MRHLIFAAPLLLASAAWSAPITAPAASAIDASQVQVTLSPEKKSMMLGEPGTLRFVVRNNSPQNWQVQVGGDYRNALGRPNSFTVKVTDAQGQPVPQPDAGMEFGGIMGPQKIPSGGSYTFDLFVPDWATFTRAGRYRFEASKVLKLSEDVPGSGRDWDTKAVAIPAQAACELEVVPRDEQKMGEVIAALGQTMLGADSDKAEGAARTLAYVQDERVIPLFVRAIGTDSYELKFIALGALSKFKSDAAFAGLKLGMATRAGDLGEGGDASLAENIRHAAAVALSQSPHPQAHAFLIAQRHDSSVGVRITVLHALGAMPPAQALPILREMASDKDKMVADEAMRYVKLLSAKR